VEGGFMSTRIEWDHIGLESLTESTNELHRSSVSKNVEEEELVEVSLSHAKVHRNSSLPL